MKIRFLRFPAEEKKRQILLYSGQVPINDRLELAESKGIRVVVEVKTSEALEVSIRSVRTNFR